MYGYQVRTSQNVASSRAPNSTISSGQSTSAGSPTATVGEIDTRAPFQSVKAAVTIFGDTSPKPANKSRWAKSTKTNEERVLEKETQLHWTLKELDKYKELLKSAESTKVQARRDLEKANQSLDELTNKLEMISEGKQAAIMTHEAAVARAKAILEEVKSNQSEEKDGWEEDVDNERSQYKTSANELISVKQELNSIKQDFDAALEAKLAAFQQAADAQHAAKVNNQKMVALAKEVDEMRDTLHRVNLAAEKTHEEHINLMEEKEALIESKKKAKEELDIKIQSLIKEHQLSELRIIGQKLEEKNEAINVLEEQLREVRVADMETLENANLAVEEATRRHEELKEEEASLVSSVESLKQDLEKVKRDIALLRGDDLKREQQQADLDKIKQEIQEAINVLTEATDSIEELEMKIKETTVELEKYRKEEEDMKKQEETLIKQSEEFDNANKEAVEKLEVAVQELEKAKAAEELANEELSKKRESSAVDNSMIKMSAQEYEALKTKGDEAAKEANSKVADIMSEVESIKKKESQTLARLDKSMEEGKFIEDELNNALKMAETAEAEKEAIQKELKKLKTE